MIKSKREMFSDIKSPENMLVERPESATDLIEIKALDANGVFQLSDKKWSISCRIQDVNFTPMTDDEQNTFLDEWRKAINSFSCEVYISTFNKNRNMEVVRDKLFYQKKGDNFDWLRDSYNNIIEDKIVNGRKSIEQIKVLTLSCTRTNYDEAKQYLNEIYSSLSNVFLSFHSRLIIMDTNERLELLYDFYHVGDEEHFNFDITDFATQGRDFRQYIAPDSMSFESEGFHLNGKVGKVLCLEPSKYPVSLEDNFFSKISNTSCVSFFTMSYLQIPQDIAIKTLESKQIGIEHDIERQQQRRNKDGNFSSDISFKTRVEKNEVEGMLAELHGSDTKVYWFGFTIVLLADTNEELERAVLSLKSLCDGTGTEGFLKPYTIKQREGLNTALPYGVRQVSKFRTLFTSSLEAFVPFNAVECQTDRNPFYYGINEVSHETIMWNRLNNTNGNGFVFGIPGGGKSFTGCKLEALSVFLKTDDDIIFIDPTLEYFNVADVLDGQKINLTSYTKQYMNPLEVDLKTLSVNDEDGQIHDKCDYMRGFIDLAMDGAMLYSHKTIVDRSVRELYHRIASLPIDERKQPIFSDFLSVVREQKEREAKDIAVAMELFTEGGLNIFNHQSNVKLDNRVLVFGLRDLGDDLQNVAMMTMLEYVRTRIIKNSQKGRNTWLYIDEIHTVLRNQYSTEYLISLWKKVRKLGGLCTGITQNVVEILETPRVSTLISNSEYTMFLKQSEPDVEALQTIFRGISPAQLNYVKVASPGTGLIKFGDAVIRFNNVISKENPIYDVFNTNAQELAEKKRKMMNRV